MDLSDLSIHFVHRLSSEPINRTILSVAHCFADKDAVYFLPHYTNVIMKYHFVKQKEQIIKIPDFDDKNFETLGFVRYSDKVYIFPAELDKGVYIFDMKIQKVDKDRKLSLLFSKFSNVDIFLVQERYVLINNGDNKIIEVDIEEGKINRIDELKKDIQIFDLIFDGEHYWILQKKSTDIYEWDRENGLFQKYTNEYAVWETQKYEISPPYSNLIFLEKEVLVLNHCMKNILRINREKKVIESPVPFPENFQLDRQEFAGWPICNSYLVLDDRVLLYPCRGNMLLIYNKATKKLTGREMTVSNQEVPYLFEIVFWGFLNDRIHYEKRIAKTLNRFVSYMNESLPEKTKRIKESTVGNQIYSMMKDT